MNANLYLRVSLKKSDNLSEFFKSVNFNVLPRIGEEIVEISENNMQYYKVEKIVHNLERYTSDFVNIFLKDICVDTLDEKEKIESILNGYDWTNEK